MSGPSSGTFTISLGPPTSSPRSISSATKARTRSARNANSTTPLRKPSSNSTTTTAPCATASTMARRRFGRQLRRHSQGLPHHRDRPMLRPVDLRLHHQRRCRCGRVLQPHLPRPAQRPSHPLLLVPRDRSQKQKRTCRHKTNTSAGSVSESRNGLIPAD